MLHLNITDTQELLDYGLASLAMRRDIAMLGLLFTVASGIAPAPISNLFKPSGGSLMSHGFHTSYVIHSKALIDRVEPSHPVLIRRSIFELIRVYNRLPQATADVKSTKLFQRRLQNCAKTAVKNGTHGWQSMCCSSFVSPCFTLRRLNCLTLCDILFHDVMHFVRQRSCRQTINTYK